ncbi:MAG: sensor histidine kinase [FCB group bacterium]|nr:sensor histidine kinase [FCB group bacterium]
MYGGPVWDDISARGVLREWRHQATNVLMMGSIVFYLPSLVLLLSGKNLPLALPVKVFVVMVYLIIVVCAILHRTNYRRRVWALLAGAYAMAVLMGAAAPQGPFVRAMPVLLPLLAMVLLGTRAGQITAVTSVIVLMVTPFLRGVPGIAQLIASDLMTPSLAPGVALTQGAGLTGMLGATMLLLDRFYRLLRESMASLEQEAADRTAAHQNLELEMLETRRLERELAQASDEERHRLGLDIHDGVCQQLTGALLRCEALARRLERGERPAAADLTALSSLLDEAINEAHLVARGLCLLDSAPEALEAALRTLAKRTQRSCGVACQFTALGNVRVSDPTTARHFHRVAQEAVSNAARHAAASRIALTLSGTPEELLLRVEDDGCGLPEDLASTGMGLRTMVYRARLLGGELTVAPVPSGGTRVSCRAPRGDVLRLDLEEVKHGS